jgi:flagellar biosynthetic protein FliO
LNVTIFRKKLFFSFAARIVFLGLLCVPVGIAFSQSKPDIGSFDIEKVRKAAGDPATVLPADSSLSVSGEKKSKASENWGLVVMRICLYLGITIAAIFLVIWGIKRIGLAGRSKIGGGSMDVLEALPLGQNRGLVLVRVVDKVYVVGQTPDQITLFETIEGQKALELISTTKGVVSMAQFKDVFGSFMGKFKAK